MTNLQPVTDYYWRLRASDGANWGQWSNTWKFTTKAFVPFSVELENKYEIVVYPNPAFESIEISANAAFNGKPNFICDVTGKEIKSGVFSYPLTRISVSELNSGIYILKAGIEGEGTF